MLALAQAKVKPQPLTGVATSSSPARRAQELVLPTDFCGYSALGPGEGLGQVRGGGEVPAGAQPAGPAPAVSPRDTASAHPRGGSLRV